MDKRDGRNACSLEPRYEDEEMHPGECACTEGNINARDIWMQEKHGKERRGW